MVKMVVFDLDDTLYPEMEFVLGGFRASADVLYSITQGQVDAFSLFVSILENEGGEKVFDKALERLGLARTDDLIQRLVNAYRYHEPNLTPFKGIPELIEDLKTKGVKIGLITDGPHQVQRRKFHALGLSHLFDAVVFSDAINGRSSWKPSPLPYIQIEKTSHLTKDSLVYVGDNPSKDFDGAEERGWLTVRVRFMGQIHFMKEDRQPVRLVAKDVEQLREILFGMIQL